MNLEKANSLLMLVANVGVIAGIVFLAVEIQQNTNMMKAQTRDSITDKQLEWYLSVGTNPYSADIQYRGIGGVDGLSANSNERFSFALINQGNFRMWENELYQYEMGLFDEDEFQPRVDSWKRLLERNAGIRSVWINASASYSPALREVLGEYSDD